MKFSTLILFGAISFSYSLAATNLASNSSQYSEEAFAKAIQEKDAKTALTLAMTTVHLHQKNVTSILFVLLAAIEYEKFHEFYSFPYLLDQDANRINNEGGRIGMCLSAMLRDSAKYTDGAALRRHVVEHFVFSDLHTLATFSSMLQTRQFPKLSSIFFDDMDLLKKFVSSSNYHYLNMSTANFPKDALIPIIGDTDPEVNKKSFISIAYYCALALKNETAAKTLKEHL